MKKLICAMTVLAAAWTAQADISYVDDDAPPGGDGLSWNTAYQLLHDALFEAANDASIDEIRVAQGLYKPDQDGFGNVTPGDRAAAFYLIDGVAIRGGYAGIGEPDPDERDVVTYETVLSGDLAGNDGPAFTNNAENSYHVVYVEFNLDTAVLDGVTMAAGNANGPEDQQRSGGGMYLQFLSPVLIDCTFRESSADLDGGGLYCNNADSNITGCSFVGNVAGRDGGGVHSQFNAPQLTDCVFSNNMTLGDGGGFSGEGDLSGCTFTANIALDDGGGASAKCDLLDCTFTSNLAGNNGGGFRQRSGNQLLIGCVFDGNAADLGGGAYQIGSLEIVSCTFTANDADLGGGVYCLNDNLDLTDCTFHQNTAVEGAGLFNQGTSPTVTDCMFTANTAENLGGGMHNANPAAPQISGSTFAGNIAAGGGGVHNDDASPVIDRCSFLANTSTGVGGGIRNHLGTVTVTGCTFDGNVAQHGAGIFSFTTAVTVTNSTFSNNRAELSSQGEGGGMSNNSLSDPIVTDCVFQDNVARKDGGGIYNELSDATITSCTFTGNSAERAGGGVANFLSSPMITDCLFDGNAASDLPNGGAGGGLSIAEADGGVVAGCDFFNNIAAGGAGLSAFGGGLNISLSSPLVIDCTFVGNSSTEFGGGAAIVHPESDPVLINCLFQGNTSETDGGGLHSHDGSSSTIIDCRFIENICLILGGGLTIQKSFPTLVNCVIAGNHAPLGGGMNISQDTGAALTNCTIVDNSADEGGGLRVDGAGSTDTLTNSIVRDNDARIGANIEGPLSVTYSNVQGGVAGDGNIDTDPLFVDPASSDYRLLPGSPCIDAGDNTAVPKATTTDLDGNPRFVDDPDTPDTGNGDPPVVDMGAYEFQGASPCPWDCGHGKGTDGTVGIVDFLALLAQWGGPGSCDFDGGGVGINDFLELLANWGPCP